MTAKAKTRIVIVVDGGNVQNAYSDNRHLEIELVDHDNLEAEGKSTDERDQLEMDATTGLYSIGITNPATYPTESEAASCGEK